MAEAATLRVAVIIPHLNQHGMLRRCLGALAKGTRQPDEVFVCDNGSDHLPPEDLWKIIPGARLLRVQEQGPGPARNAGVGASSADLLAFIDADCVPTEDWLKAVCSASQHTPDTVLGGDVRIGPDAPTTASACYEAVYGYRSDRYIAREGFAATCNMAVPRSVWDRVGTFGGIGMAEDRDWGQRATAAGVPIRFEREMPVFHPARPDLAALCTKWDRMIAHDHAQLDGSWRCSIRWMAKALALPISPVAELPRLILTDRLNGADQRVRAIAGLFQIRWHRGRRMALLALRPDTAKTLATSWNRT